MKRIVTTLLVALLMLSAQNIAFAQWRVYDIPGDELLGTKPHTMCTYTDDYGQRITFMRIGGENKVVLETDEGYFEVKDGSVPVLIGFYKNGKLVEKMTKFFNYSSESNSTYNPSFQANNIADKVMQHIKEVGDVRFVVNLRNGYRYDLKAPTDSKVRTMPL